ncbi:MAG: hypothetical protein ACYDAB_01230 [bacterium]
MKTGNKPLSGFRATATKDGSLWGWIAAAAGAVFILGSLLAGKRHVSRKQGQEDEEDWTRLGGRQLQERYPEWDVPARKSDQERA